MEFKSFDLGLVDFERAWDFQKEVFQKVKNNELPAGLIICRHYPVITMARNAVRKNVLATNEELQAKKISLFQIERGGDVTYHGPGQLVIYPIVNLSRLKKDIHLFLRNLEEVAIQALRNFSIKAQRKKGFTGVWVGDAKIASIGIAIKNWITFHGLSLNIERQDLKNFSLIRPCGLDIMMTSMETVLDKRLPIDEVKPSIHKTFLNLFS
jgi:lipoate-protein ligase B